MFNRQIIYTWAIFNSYVTNYQRVNQRYLKIELSSSTKCGSTWIDAGIGNDSHYLYRLVVNSAGNPWGEKLISEPRVRLVMVMKMITTIHKTKNNKVPSAQVTMKHQEFLEFLFSPVPLKNWKGWNPSDVLSWLVNKKSFGAPSCTFSFRVNGDKWLHKMRWVCLEIWVPPFHPLVNDH